MIIKGVEYKFGADPEIFVKSRNNNLISAYGMIPGDKANPYPVKFGAVQVDGMALEFNINPAVDYDEWENNITVVMSQLERMIPQDYTISIQSTAEFGEDYINSQPSEAKHLGCDPDFNAYTKSVNPKPRGDMGFRTAAGHIHVGWINNEEDAFNEDHITKCVDIVKNMDSILGIYSILEDPDNKRRMMYGAAGAFRIKPYGVEYRVLSNYWLKTKELRKSVYERTCLSLEKYHQGAFNDDVFEMAKDIINLGNVDEAKRFKSIYID